MTRKDFQLIADALAWATPVIDISEPVDARTTGMIATWVASVNEMASHLRNDNPRFDMDRFFKACTINTSWCNRFAISLPMTNSYGRIDWLPAHEPVQA
tara:strand:- start:57 stop:353 length:297 start_codon:yes stop_codon:yes gene_type:complete